MTAFGTLPDGQPVERLELAAGELSVAILTLGAILQDVRLAGVEHSLTLGSGDLAAYEGPMAYFGAVVGPVANRVAGATCVVDGKRLSLVPNERGRTTLHGGALGTHARIWEVLDHGPDHATLALTLPDGEEGWPGTRRLTARFRVLPPATLEMVLEAETDAPTPVNLANHSYWCLGPDGLTGHKLQIAADRYLPVDADLIPAGPPAAVTGTAFDFRSPAAIGPQGAASYDHNFCLTEARRPLAEAVRLTGPSGLVLTIETTEPGLQVYDAARLDTGDFRGHDGAPYGPHAGVALEAQGWPDAPNRPDFPPVLLRPGETYRQVTRWSFGRG